MPLLLRKIRKSRWYKYPWLEEGGSQADALLDLKTDDNILSVWYIEDDKSNLERVLAALASNSDNISNVDYALFEEQDMLNMDIKLDSTKGNVPDDEVSNSWHRHLSELSAMKLAMIAKTIQTVGEIDRKQPQEVKKLLKESVVAGKIESSKLNPKIRAAIDPKVG